MSTCYNIGDIGPAGGLVFAVPYTGLNQSKYYYEISLDNINKPSFLPNISAGPFSLPTTPLSSTTQIPGGIPQIGSEWGAYGQNVNTSPAFGDGRKNTDILTALPTGPTVQTVSLTLLPPQIVNNPIITLNSLSFGTIYDPVVGSVVTSTVPNLILPGTTIQSVNILSSSSGTVTEITLSQPLQASAFPSTPFFNFTFQNNFSSTNPTLPLRDLAATQCVQHSVTDTDGNVYEDWFLPSREEIQEAYDVLGAGDLNLDGNKYYWTSTGDNNNLLAITAILIDQAFPVIAPTFQTLDRSLVVNVRPVRRFICKDKGIDYDYRLNIQSYGTTGAISFLATNSPVYLRARITAKAYSFQMPLLEASGEVYSNGFVSFGGPFTSGNNFPVSGFIPQGVVVLKFTGTNKNFVDANLSLSSTVTAGSLSLGPVREIKIFSLVTWVFFGAWDAGTQGLSSTLPSLNISSQYNDFHNPFNIGPPDNIDIQIGDSDTAFLINSNALSAVPHNFAGNLPASYVPSVSTGIQLIFQNNIAWGQFGTIDEVINIATDPNYGPAFQLQYQLLTGDAVDTIIVFKPTYGQDPSVTNNPTNNWPVPGPNGPWTESNYPQFSFVDEITWITPQNVPNPSWSPSPFFANGIPIGTGGLEIGHDTIAFPAGSFDTRGNDMRVQLHNAGGYYTSNTFIPNQFQNKVFNIKIYDQFEKLICDYDYEMTNANSYTQLGSLHPEPYDYPGCGKSACRFWFAGKLVSTNYVDTSIPNQAFNSFGNHIVDLGPYFGQDNQLWGRKGNGYVAITVKNPETGTLWNSNMQRGNTLNLVNWLGLGNHRSTDPNNLPAAYNTQFNRFGWGVVCQPCGTTSSNGTTPTGCSSFTLREWLAEVPYAQNVTNCNNYNGSYNMYYPGFAHTGTLNGNGQGWIDAANVGCPEPTGGTGGPGSGGPSTITTVGVQQAQNCQDEYKSCFDNWDTDYPLSSLGVYYVPPSFEEILREELEVVTSPLENKNANRRQKIANKNSDIETGPFGISGYYPLYDTIQAATLNSPTPILSKSNEETYGYHIHQFGNKEYYMPNGLEMGVTQFHGDWDGTEIIEFSKIEQPPQTVKYLGTDEDFTLQDIQPEEVITVPTQEQYNEITTTSQNITPEEETQDQVRTARVSSALPTSTSPSVSGGGGGSY